MPMRMCAFFALGVLCGLPASGQSLQEASEAQAELPADGVPSVDAAPLPAFAEDPEVGEPDYAQVAADARKIVAEIEERQIEMDMDDGVDAMSAGDGAKGHAKVNEAYEDMKAMIKFCDQAGEGAQKACKFKLEITMSTTLGDTLAQLAKGMKPGAGGIGAAGQGSSGQSGGSVPYGLYGPETFGEKMRQSKSLGKKKVDNVEMLPGTPDPLANGIEEVSSSKKEDVQFNAEGDERIMEEYRGLIEEYFKRMAEEE